MRLIGDDRQQAARGAGGVLRDIAATHGAVELAEVLRFADDREKAASLALRAGDPLALGFYLDQHRLHVAAPDAVIDTVYAAWAADIAAGRQSLMTAPTLDHVTQLNARARDDRIAHLLTAGGRVGREVQTAAGETLSRGDTIYTKANDRRLSLGGTDYVKNNDRWVITNVCHDGSVDVAHAARAGVTIRLPADYLDTNVRLGYAATDRSVQGSTVGRLGGALGRVEGTCHSLIAAGADRNTFYTDMTRGTDANHAYFTIGGTGDLHELIRPDAVSPPTVADLALAVLARDASARSVATEQRETADPYRQLGHAADAYTHTIDVLAVDALGQPAVEALTAAAEQAVPGVTTAPAWYTLRAHLAVLALDGHDPIAALCRLQRRGGSWAPRRIWLPCWTGGWIRAAPTPNAPDRCPGCRPSRPRSPTDPTSSPYLRDWEHRITTLVEQLDAQVQAWTPRTAPAWALPYLDNPDLLVDLARWRAARSIPDIDLDPAGAHRPPAIALAPPTRRAVQPSSAALRRRPRRTPPLATAPGRARPHRRQRQRPELARRRRPAHPRR